MRRRKGLGMMPVAIALAVSIVAGTMSASAASSVESAEPSASQIVVLHKVTGTKAASTAADLTHSFGGSVTTTYRSAIVGFAADMTAEQVAAMSTDPRVASIEPDVTMAAAGSVGPGAAVQKAKPTNRWATDSWALDRLDARKLKLDGSFHHGGRAGAGVTAYVIDTGIYAEHPDFGGRASTGLDLVPFEPGTDMNGHGTHVAGLIGGSEHGDAPNATLVAVKVLDSSGRGPLSNILAGLDWVAMHHASRAVANLSIGGPPSDILDAAVNNLIASGVSVVAAAGNQGADACASSPSAVTSAIVVGATDRHDAVPTFSNQGSCVDVFAPGSDVVSDWIPVPPGGQAPPPGWIEHPTMNLSGTSMAAPLVSGAAAIYLSNHPAANPKDVANAIVRVATKGRLSGVTPATPNRLLFVHP